jgi:hypothetical protein
VAISDHYNTTCTFLTPSGAVDAFGAQTFATSTLSANVPCYFNPKGASDAIRRGKLNNSKVANLYCAPVTGLISRHQVTVASTGKTYNISFSKDTGGRGHHLKIELELVE